MRSRLFRVIVEERTEPDRRRFPPRPDSVREARTMIRECLARHGREDLVETAELLVSEIVTNALVHAGTTIEVAFSFVGGGLRVEVTDGSPHEPARRGYGPSAGTGRGLMLLEDMVDAWGVTPRDLGKTVWFQITSRDPSTADTEPVPTDPARGPSPVGRTADLRTALTVTLLDVPLLLHEAWRQHAESLLREHLLASLDLSDGPDPIEVHAQASAAISLLAEQVPPSGIGEDPVDVMVNATDPQVTAAEVRLRIPDGAVEHFATLDRTLEHALALADAGLLLTPTTQPELQALRTWICGEVRGQVAGAAPTGWSALGKLPLAAPHLLRWDTDHVTEATTAVLAADDADRIVAVSRPALALLGHADDQDLVGSRLIGIIPPRYRQAHLAGFTLHFLSGRAPLIGNTVTVPALRADGSETMVSLTIRVEHTGDGRTVFVATLEPAGS